MSAMTRAEERLYVCGYQGRTAPKDGCWHRMISNALAGVLEPAPSHWSADEQVRRRGQAAMLDEDKRVDAPAIKAQPPAWLFAKAAREKPQEPPISPSSALSAADQTSEAGPRPCGRRSAGAERRGHARGLADAHAAAISPGRSARRA